MQYIQDQKILIYSIKRKLEIFLKIGSVEILISVFNSISKIYQLADKLSFLYSDAQCGYAGIGRQAWLRAKWGFPVRVRVSLAAPKL